MVKISIIVPVYNAEEYLDSCISSILNQTLTNIEVILINDGSTDKSLEICNCYKNLDNRIKVFSIENSGSAKARNVGLNNAKGEYIGFVDADDYIEKEMYEVLFNKAKEKSIDIVSCNLVRDFTDKSIQNKIEFDNGYYSKKDIFQKFYPELIKTDKLTSEIPFNMVSKIFKHSLIKDNDIKFANRLKGGQDFVFSITCIFYSNSFYLMKDRYYYHYVYNDKSRTNRYMANSWDIYKEINEYFKKLLENNIEYDFTNQIKRDLLSGAITAIGYECKKGNPKPISEIYNEFKKICLEFNKSDVFELLNYKEIEKQKKILIYCIKNNFVSLILLLCYLKKISNIIKD